MANWNNNEPSFCYVGHATLGVNLNRQKNAPLDISCEFNSLKDALYYVTEGRYPVAGEGVSDFVKGMKKYPYLGQIISIVNVLTEAVSLYYIKTSVYDASLSTDDEVFAHYFEEVGKSTAGDNHTISLSDNGVFSLTNFGVKYYRWVDPVGEEGLPGYISGHHELVVVDEEHPWVSGLEPRAITKEGGGFELAWYEPAANTIEGLNSTVGTLSADLETAKTNISNLQAHVGNDGSDGQAKTGLYADIASAEEAIVSIQSTLGDSDDSLSESVNTVWANVNKTSYDISALKESLESDYTRTEDLPDALADIFDAKGSAGAVDEKVTALDSRVAANESAITVLNGDASVEGSVDKKIETAISGLDLSDTYAAKVHDHTIAQITGLQDVLDGLQTAISEKQEAGDYATKSEAQGYASTAETNAKNYADGLAINYAPASDSERISDIEADIVVLKGDGEGSISYIADEKAKAAINEFATNISDDGTINTFKELVDYVAAHSPEAADMAADIVALKSVSHSHVNKTVLDEITEEKVTAWDAAQSNIIEVIQLNGVTADINDKVVNIPAATADTLGLVKVDDETIEVTEGVVSVKEVGVSKLYVEEGTELILNGGVA